jgi:hypothetical protein
MPDKEKGTTRVQDLAGAEKKSATEWIAASSVAVQAATNLYQTIKKPKSPPPEKKDD